MKFFQRSKSVLSAITIVGFLFLVMDIYFTQLGVWGFRPEYHLNILFFGLPIEEWLFFLAIPYASVFLHVTFEYLLPKIALPLKTTQIISLILLLLSGYIAIENYNKLYTVYSFGLLFITLLISFFDKTETLRRFYLSFLIILIPFCIVNSILTGSFIENEVVWYNNAENLGLRLFTIPIEDFGYGFSLILLNLLLINRFRKMDKI